jgi:tRNA modification GTPase
MSPASDTIFALSSGRGPAAIAVVRISGPRAGMALTALGVKIPQPRKAGLARVRDPESGEMIDEALVLWFPGPNSETGEDVAELQLHGGRAVIAATLAALGRIEGLRAAEGGEFTRRAFENGKLDLTAVEGLADLVSAETEGQRRQAFRQMKGLLGDRAETWRQRLIQALALVEARIDFSDEADVPEDLVQPALAIANELRDEIALALADGGRGERLREGLVVAIAGPPNAGKSTLLNRIARREVAIVSPYAGTTRDVIEVHLDLGGLPVTLLDTAGIRETDDPVELEGVRRARARAADADLVLWVVDASAGPQPGASGAMADLVKAERARWPSGFVPSHGNAAEANVEERAGPGPDTGGASVAKIERVEVSGTVAEGAAADVGRVARGALPPLWLIRNKIDLVDQGLRDAEPGLVADDSSEPKVQTNRSIKSMVNKELSYRNELGIQTNKELKHVINETLPEINEQEIQRMNRQYDVSSVSGVGIDPLLRGLELFAEDFLAGAQQALVTRERHRAALQQALGALQRAVAGELGGREDLLAEELRAAAAALGRLTGRVDVEDILDVIFRDFCIGK